MWKYVCDSVAGEAHVRTSTPCQDASRAQSIKDVTGRHVMLLVAADGSGSASQAEKGANEACHSVLRQAVGFFESGGDIAHIDRDLLISWVDSVREDIESLAVENGSQIREFAATLLIAILSDEHSVFAQIGDGAIVVKHDGRYLPVFWPVNGEFANETVFVTEATAAERLEWSSMSGSIDEVAVFTDGLQRLALNAVERSAHAPFFSPLFAGLRAAPSGDDLAAPLRSLLRSERFSARSDDDKTLILAVRIPGNFIDVEA